MVLLITHKPTSSLLSAPCKDTGSGPDFGLVSTHSPPLSCTKQYRYTLPHCVLEKNTIVATYLTVGTGYSLVCGQIYNLRLSWIYRQRRQFLVYFTVLWRQYYHQSSNVLSVYLRNLCIWNINNPSWSKVTKQTKKVLRPMTDSSHTTCKSWGVSTSGGTLSSLLMSSCDRTTASVKNKHYPTYTTRQNSIQPLQLK